MISDRDRLLISAYVSGDLDAGRQRDVEDLLERAPEARQFAEELRGDVRRLRDLPRHKPDGDVGARVLRAIVERRVEIRPERPVTVRPILIATWGSLAAAVFVAFVTATHLLLTDLPGGLPQSRRPLVAKDQDQRSQAELITPPVAERSDGHSDLDSRPLPGPAVAAVPTPPTDPTPRADEKRPTTSGAAVPENAVLSSGPKPDLRPGAVVVPALPLPLPVRELERADYRRKLAEALRPDDDYRIELFCRDSAKALERLQASARPYNVQILIDAAAQELFKRRLRVPYAIYLEGLTPEQLPDLLKNLGARDKKAEERRVGEGTFDQLVLVPLSTDDRKELVALMGVDPTQPAAKPKGPLGVDVRKPLSDSTAAQVAQSTPGPGGRTDVQALVMPYGVVRSPAASKEVKQFFAGRRDRPTGTVAVYLILRLTSG